MGTLSKSELRLRIVQSRARRSADERLKLGHELAQHEWNKLIPGKSVTCYASLPEEPDTGLIREQLAAAGVKVFLPIVKPEHKLGWGLDDQTLHKSNFGIFEPSEAMLPVELSALIIPSLAVGRDGSRLGKGAGYYDRFLAGTAPHHAGGPIRIALVFDDEVFDSVPHEEHDEQVDLIVTPTTVIYPND